MHRLYFMALSLFVFLQLQGQTDFETAKKFADKNKEQDAIILNNITNVSFFYDDRDQQVKVRESSELQCLSLRPNNTVTFGLHYDNNITIAKAKSPGNMVEKTCGNYRPDWIFHSDDMLCTYSISFKDAGEEKPFIYERNYTDVRYFTTCYFTNRYPTLKNIIRFQVPEGLNIEFKEYNTEDYALKITKKTDPKEKTTTIEYECENMPGYNTDEKKTPKFSFVYPHLLVIPKSYHTKEANLEIFGSLNDFYQWSLSMAKKTPNTSASLKPFTDKLIADKTTDIEKIKTIYYWVQDNIRYLAFEGGLQGYVPEDAEKVFTQKFGDCKGKANLLKTMLCLSGYDARLTWIGTDEVRYDFSTPNLATCDHMVCALFLKGKHYILDATSNYTSFPKNPEYIQGRQALIEDGNHYILDTVPMADANENLIFSKNHFTIANKDMHGSLIINFSGDQKRRMLKKLNNTRTDELQKLLDKIVTREDPKVLASNITLSDIQNREEPLVIKSDICVKGNIIAFEKDLYISADPFDDLSDWTIKADRLYPLDISQKINRKTETILELPDGFKIQKMPEEKVFSNDLIRFKIGYSTDGKIIIYTKEIQTLTQMISKKQFQAWNDALKLLKRTCSQPIVISKIEQ